MALQVYYLRTATLAPLFVDLLTTPGLPTSYSHNLRQKPSHRRTHHFTSIVPVFSIFNTWPSSALECDLALQLCLSTCFDGMLSSDPIPSHARALVSANSSPTGGTLRNRPTTSTWTLRKTTLIWGPPRVRALRRQLFPLARLRTTV